MRVTLINGDVLKAKNPHRPSRQTASASGSVEQGERGLRMGYGQGDTGKADSRPHVENPIRGLPPHAGEHQRVREVTVNDAG
jgi:hypothetical protein